MLPELLRVLRGLRRGDAHGAGGAERTAVRALPFRQPGEEGLAEIAPDRLGVRAHLRRLLRDQLSDSWRDNDARSWKLRMRVRLAERLSSMPAISLSPVWVE